MNPITAKPMATALQMCRYSENQDTLEAAYVAGWGYPASLCRLSAPCQELQIMEGELKMTVQLRNWKDRLGFHHG